MKKWLIIGGVLTIVVVLAVVFSKKNDNGGVSVKIEKITRGKIIEKVNGIGKIEPDLQVQISAKVAGEIIDMRVKEGQRVKAGQFLLQLEKDQYEAILGQAKSSLKAARANSIKSRSSLQRVEKMAKQDLASDSEYETAKADYDYNMSQVERAQASVEDAEQAVQKTTIVSPIAGIITKLNKKEGEIALGSQFQKDVIMTVADLKTMQARIEIDENDIVKVNIGDTSEVEIDAFPDRKFPGLVKEIANSAAVTGQGTQQEVTNFEVRIDLLQILPKFRPGMSCNANIITEVKDDVLRVPIQAVAVRTPEELLSKKDKNKKEKSTSGSTVEENKKNQLVEIVFTVKNDTAYAVPLKRGIGDETYYEAVEGLSDNDMIVTGPYRALTKELQTEMRVKEQKKDKPKSGK